MNIILKKQLMFIFHLANLPEDSLGREVFEIQHRNALPGLILENEEHLNALNFHVNRYMNKWKWKKVVSPHLRNKNKEKLLRSIKGYKKIDYNQCVNEKFERK